MNGVAARTARTIGISIAAVLGTLVVALLLHFVVPETLRFGESNPPVLGHVYAAEEVQQKEAVAAQELRRAMATTPRLTVGGLVRGSVERFAWVAALAHLAVVIFMWGGRLNQHTVAAVPFVVFAVVTSAYWLVLVFAVVISASTLAAGSKSVATGT